MLIAQGFSFLDRISTQNSVGFDELYSSFGIYIILPFPIVFFGAVVALCAPHLIEVASTTGYFYIFFPLIALS